MPESESRDRAREQPDDCVVDCGVVLDGVSGSVVTPDEAGAASPCFSSPVDWLRLHLAVLYRPELLDQLVEHLGSLTSVYDCVAKLDEEARRVGWMTPGLHARLADRRWRRQATRELELCRHGDVDLCIRGSDAWPGALVGLPRMPLLLFMRGRLGPEDSLAVSIVGTRRPTPYGIRQARRFAGELAAMGVTVVSGLARGIDTEAHGAALEAGGRTVAVLGSGLGRIYPRENCSMVAAILERQQGAIITEFPWSSAPQRYHFPLRNRILSGLACAVIVIEAGQKSGSLLTVDWALQQGRPVLVLPGRVDQPQAVGCLELIREGAHPVISPADVIEFLGSTGALSIDRKRSIARKTSCLHGEDPFRDRLLELFEERDAWHPDELCSRLELTPGALLQELSRLESVGQLRRITGGRYILVDLAPHE